MATPAKPRRPAVVTILTIILVVSAIATILFGVVEIALSKVPISITVGDVVAPTESEAYLTDQGELLVDGVSEVIVGVVQLVIAIGFWAVRRWAWIAAITWQAFQLLLSVGYYLGGNPPDWTLIFPIVLIFLLNQTELRRHFGVIERQNESTRPALRPLDVE